ncbi:helicase associated domain-containing protein [Brevibacterium linens]|uniref:helicase associated domain-containing protein n=1 Tax=Brevibacterium linens TaxID=1703 RepID=UPI003AF31E8C
MGRGRVDFDRGILRLSSYAKIYGSANPKSNEVWLEWTIGLWVSRLRKKYRDGSLTSEQIATAEAVGVRFVPPYQGKKPAPPTRAERQEIEYLARLDRLQGYFREHGHINVGQLHGIEGWQGAGRWISRIRSLRREGSLPLSVIQKAEKMNIIWEPGPGSRTIQREQTGPRLPSE